MPNGVMKPCCEFVSTSEWNEKINVINFSDPNDYFKLGEVKQLETDLENNKFPKECQSCAKLEQLPETANRSWRAIQNNMLSNTDFMLELRLSNLCNYRCYTCGPNGSSRIEDDFTKLKIPFVQSGTKWENVAFDNISALIEKSTYVNFLGGEPLYNKTSLALIPQLCNKKQISITTNGSKFVPEFAEIDNLLLSFSIDNLYHKNEYMRNGSDWNVVISNLHKSLACDNIKTHVVTTISIYNVFSLFEIFEYFLALQLDHYHLNIVYNPDFMAVTNLHPNLKGLAITEIEKCKVLPLNNIMLQTLQYLEANVSKEFTPEKWEKFMLRTNQLDTLRNTSVFEFVPELTLLDT